MGALLAQFARQPDELHRLDAARLPEDSGYRSLDRLVLVVKVHEDRLHRILEEALGPVFWDDVEEDLKYLAGLDADAVLCVIEALDQFSIQLAVVLFVHQRADH